jgi:hypothetical protein
MNCIGWWGGERMVGVGPFPRYQLHGACETGERKYCIENIECSNECELGLKHGWEFYIFLERIKDSESITAHHKSHTATAIPFIYSFSGNSGASALISTFMCL